MFFAIFLISSMAAVTRYRHIEGQHLLYCLAYINTVILSRKLRWARHVACVEDVKTHIEMWLVYLKWKGRFEDLGLRGGIILKWISEKRTLIGAVSIREADSCGHECRHLCVIRSGGFVDSWATVSSCQVSSAVWSHCVFFFQSSSHYRDHDATGGTPPQVRWIWGRKIEWNSKSCQTFQIAAIQHEVSNINDWNGILKK